MTIEAIIPESLKEKLAKARMDFFLYGCSEFFITNEEKDEMVKSFKETAQELKEI